MEQQPYARLDLIEEDNTMMRVDLLEDEALISIHSSSNRLEFEVISVDKEQAKELICHLNKFVCGGD